MTLTVNSIVKGIITLQMKMATVVSVVPTDLEPSNKKLMNSIHSQGSLLKIPAVAETAPDIGSQEPGSLSQTILPVCDEKKSFEKQEINANRVNMEDLESMEKDKVSPLYFPFSCSNCETGVFVLLIH